MSCEAFFDGYISNRNTIFCADDPLTGERWNALRYSRPVLPIILPK